MSRSDVTNKFFVDTTRGCSSREKSVEVPESFIIDPVLFLGHAP